MMSTDLYASYSNACIIVLPKVCDQTVRMHRSAHISAG